MSTDERDVIAAAWATPRVERPTQCIHCADRRIWWNGTRKRSASVLIDGRVAHLRAVVCARVKCAGCLVSWTLRPPGLLPHKHILTQSVGFHGPVEPDTTTRWIERGDIFVLCSDGMTDPLEDDQIARIMEGTRVEDLPAKLVQEALRAGSEDNITVVVVGAR